MRVFFLSIWTWSFFIFGRGWSKGLGQSGLIIKGENIILNLLTGRSFDFAIVIKYIHLQLYLYSYLYYIPQPHVALCAICDFVLHPVLTNWHRYVVVVIFILPLAITNCLAPPSKARQAVSKQDDRSVTATPRSAAGAEMREKQQPPIQYRQLLLPNPIHRIHTQIPHRIQTSCR